MQVRTPAREPGLWVGLDDVPYRDKTQQAGLDRTLLAAYTGTHYGRTRGVPLGSRGHLSNKLTVSGLPRHPAEPAPASPVHPARRRRRKGRPYQLTPLSLPSLPSLAGLLGRNGLPSLLGRAFLERLLLALILPALPGLPVLARLLVLLWLPVLSVLARLPVLLDLPVRMRRTMRRRTGCRSASR
jgi:hypothetical protein